MNAKKNSKNIRSSLGKKIFINIIGTSTTSNKLKNNIYIGFLDVTEPRFSVFAL